MFFPISRNSRRRCLFQKVFLKTSQNSKGNTCLGLSFLIRLQVLHLTTSMKRWLWHKYFLRILRNFKENLFYIEHFRWLLLHSFQNNFFGIYRSCCFLLFNNLNKNYRSVVEQDKSSTKLKLVMREVDLRGITSRTKTRDLKKRLQHRCVLVKFLTTPF